MGVGVVTKPVCTKFLGVAIMVAVEEKCFGAVCFIKLPEGIPQVFGFSEYMTGLAVMVIAWTLADYRYHFRLETAAFPIKPVSFWALVCLGLLTIATDLWRAEGYWVLTGGFLTPVAWQGVLALSFVSLFLGWAWFGLMCPSKIGPRNAEIFKNAVQRRILSSGEPELALLADELVFSAENIVALTPVHLERELEGTKLAVRDLLLTMADPRFCNVVVSKRPILAISLYENLGERSVYPRIFDHLSKNLAVAAFTNETSVLVYETDGYDTGFWGYTKPFTRAFFGNSAIVDSVGTMFDVPYEVKQEWGKREWDLYARAILVFLEDRLKRRRDWSHSFPLHRALGSMMGFGAFTLSEIDAKAAQDNIYFQRFARSCRLMESILDLLRDQPEIDHIVRIKGNNFNLLDSIAQNAFELLATASYVRNHGFLCWEVQHNMAWSSIFGRLRSESRNTRIVQKIVSRKVLDKVVELARGNWPGYDAARMLGLCINVLTLDPSLDRSKVKEKDRNTFALRVAILLWMRHHFAWLYSAFPEVAQAALVEKIDYDETNSRLVIKSLWGRGQARYIDLDGYVFPPPRL